MRLEIGKICLLMSCLTTSLFCQSGPIGTGATLFTLRADSLTADLGGVVTLSATITPSSATGKVTFYSGVDVVGEADLTGGVARVSTRQLSAGKNLVYAYYRGDSNYYVNASNSLFVEIKPKSSTFLASTPEAPVPTTQKPSKIATGDFNADGNPDFVISNAGLFGFGGSDEITVYLGNGKGGFSVAPQSPIRTDVGPQGIAVGDFNRDGKADLAVGHRSRAILILLGDGTGRFVRSAGGLYYSPVGDGVYDLAVFDYNSDGILDLASPRNNTLEVLIGRGDGSFRVDVPLLTAANFPAGSFQYRFFPSGVRAGSFSRVGSQDIAILSTASGEQSNPGSNVTILRNTGNGFRMSQITVARNPNYMTVGDWNGDGLTDIATVGSGNSVVTFLLSPGYNPKEVNPFGSSSSIILSAEPLDFDGDGNLDLCVARPSFGDRPTSFGVLLGDGKGNFRAASDLAWGPGIQPRAMVVADFNRDGRQDIAVADDSNQSVAVYAGVSKARMDGLATSSPQFAKVGTEFSNPLAVKLVDEAGAVLVGAAVTFRYPPVSTTRASLMRSGPGSPDTYTAVSNSQGVAQTFVTANGVIGGPYEVIASAAGVADVKFSLSNVPSGAASSAVMTTSPNPSFVGEVVRVNVQLTPETATGAVDILDGTTVVATIGRATFFPGLTWSIDLSDLKLGSRTLTARYRGNDTLAAATLAAVTHVVRASAANSPAIRAGGVVNGASLQAGMSAGTWLTIYGTGLSTTTRTWGSGDFDGAKLPTQLDGVRVTVSGEPAYVYFVSPNQINILSPKRAGTGTGVAVQVVNSAGASNIISVRGAVSSPALFSYSAQGGRYVIAQDAQSFGLIGPDGLLGAGVGTRPAKAGQLLTLYATGLGETSPPYPDGQLSGALSLSRLPAVTVGGQSATVSYAGLIGPGLYQINISVPEGVRGDSEILVRIANDVSPNGFLLAVE